MVPWGIGSIGIKCRSPDFFRFSLFHLIAHAGQIVLFFLHLFIRHCCLGLIMGGVFGFDLGAFTATVRSTAGWAILLVNSIF